MWTQSEIDSVRRDYPDTDTEELAARLGRTVVSVYGRSNILGVSKSAAYVARKNLTEAETLRRTGVVHRFPKGHVPANKGLRRPGWSPGRMATTQFKKGRPACESRNYKPIGSLRVTKDGLLRKVTDDPYIWPARRWVAVHRLAWIDANGPVPPGHAVAFKAGRSTTDLDKITADAVELITRAELMRRNSYHNNYPKPIAELIQLSGAVRRQINRRLRKAEKTSSRTK